MTWHVVSASAEEIEASCARPSVLYACPGDDLHGELRLFARSVVTVHGGLHWLLSGEIPGESGPTTPLVFLDRGGLAIELRKELVLADGTRWACASARTFSPDERQAILDAITALDQEALLRKGGAPSFATVQALCRLLVADVTTRFVVSGNACFVAPTAALPLFTPALSHRERQPKRHVSGALPEGAAARARRIGGDGFIGFGSGPALALSPSELTSLDLSRPATAVDKFLRRSQQRGEGVIAYQRPASWEVYETATYWLALGYFDVSEVVDQLEEELDEAPSHEVLARAVAATSEILALDQATWPARTDCDRLFAALEQLRGDGMLVFEYAGFTTSDGAELVSGAMRDQQLASRPFCFFHQQCILGALDGKGLSLYFGEATHDADEVEMRPSEAVGHRVAAALAANDLQVEWDGTADTAILVRLVWQCRPRRHARSRPPQLPLATSRARSRRRRGFRDRRTRSSRRRLRPRAPRRPRARSRGR